MKNWKSVCALSLAVALLVAIGGVSQAAEPETVLVGDAGNKADTTGFGAVAYEYRIGKYEVTNEQYCEFLNAVAKSDPYNLYDGRMSGGPENWGGIRRRGQPGSFTYEVRDNMGRKPVNYVTWESCLRYCNWLTNGRGDGETESGAYDLKWGQVTVPDHAALAAAKKVTWLLPSEDEWYKAAYYDPDKSGGPGYWIYAAPGYDVPKCNINTNWPTDVGHYDEPSPYGTYDQNGNVWEYTDSRSGNKVGLRGGSFFLGDNANYLRSSTRYDVLGAKWPNYGFRVVSLGSSE